MEDCNCNWQMLVTGKEKVYREVDRDSGITAAVIGQSDGQWPGACRVCGRDCIIIAAADSEVTGICRFRGRDGGLLYCDAGRHRAMITIPAAAGQGRQSIQDGGNDGY